MVERLLPVDLDGLWSAVRAAGSASAEDEAPADREHRLLDGIDGPADVRALPAERLPELADELRALLVEQVTRTGGHLGPNLGVVELTIALHRVFDSPRDTVLWDTGHQAYVHKALTGRWRAFDRLRSRGGLSGYPDREESPHDHVENSHASTALSWAYGVALGHTLLGEHDRRVVAVVGDGALTGGMAWEALNNIGGRRCRVVILLNDNGRSYAPTVGGVAEHLARLRAGAGQGNVFAELGLTYLGPVDGHDLAAVETALAEAAAQDGPVVVHCVTSKGRGHAQAERHEVDQFHAVRAATAPGTAPAGPSWTSVFGAELVRLGDQHPELVALTAAMLDPAGLTPFARRFPDRVLDVGIAEQHAVTAAAGLAAAGARPVVAVYATFLTRALDQVLMDVALHRAPVVFVLDRAGVTGDDGASHNGVWDMAMLGVVPGLWIAAPRDARTLRAALRAALRRTDGPTVVRFPKGPVGPDVPAPLRRGGLDVLRTDAVDDVLLVGVGPMAGLCLEAARLLHEHGVGVTVVDPRWVRPANRALVGLAARFDLVATVEDGLLDGGFGGALARVMREEGSPTPLVEFAVPRGFLRHGSRAEVLADCGLTAQGVADRVAARLHRPIRVIRPAG